MNQNQSFNLSEEFDHIKNRFIESALIELKRFNSTDSLGRNEQNEIVAYIQHCGKELKLHTLIIPEQIESVVTKLFNNTTLSTFVLCTTDRFFIEIKPFEDVLHKHLTGMFHIEKYDDASLMPNSMLDNFSSISKEIVKDKTVTLFFAANSWLVSVILLIITHEQILSKLNPSKQR